MKIAFINHKGGIGKTTLAVNTAFRSLELKRKLLLLDFDEQKNSMQLFSGYCWSNEPMYNEDDYIWLVNGNVGRINCNWSEFDNILFDCPPSYLSADSFMNFLQNHNLSVDLWVVPVESRTSISGATTVTSKIRQYYPNSRILIVLNRCASGEITQADRMEIARFPNIELSKIIIPASKTGLHKFEQSGGKSVWHYYPRVQTSTRMRDFCDALLKGMPYNTVIKNETNVVKDTVREQFITHNIRSSYGKW